MSKYENLTLLKEKYEKEFADGRVDEMDYKKTMDSVITQEIDSIKRIKSNLMRGCLNKPIDAYRPQYIDTDCENFAKKYCEANKLKFGATLELIMSEPRKHENFPRCSFQLKW